MKEGRRLTLPSSGPAYGGPLKSNVRPHATRSSSSYLAAAIAIVYFWPINSHLEHQVAIWGAIAVILVITTIAVAIGFNTIAAALLSFVASYSWFVVSLGGFKTSESAAMAVGFGLMFMIPTSVGIGVAVLLGHLVLRLVSGKNKTPLQRLAGELAPSPVVDSVSEAVNLAAHQFRVGSRIRVRCSNCIRVVSARRIRSSTNATPDIEINCHCGACFGVRAFRDNAA